MSDFTSEFFMVVEFLMLFLFLLQNKDILSKKWYFGAQDYGLDGRF